MSIDRLQCYPQFAWSQICSSVDTLKQLKQYQMVVSRKIIDKSFLWTWINDDSLRWSLIYRVSKWCQTIECCPALWGGRCRGIHHAGAIFNSAETANKAEVGGLGLGTPKSDLRIFDYKESSIIYHHITLPTRNYISTCDFETWHVPIDFWKPWCSEARQRYANCKQFGLPRLQDQVGIPPTTNHHLISTKTYHQLLKWHGFLFFWAGHIFGEVNVDQARRLLDPLESLNIQDLGVKARAKTVNIRHEGLLII